LRTLPSSVYRKSFVCHSYVNCRGRGPFFPFWDSSSPNLYSLISDHHPPVPLRPPVRSATMASVLAEDHETSSPLPVSKKSERTSGPAIVPSQTRVAVVPKVAGRSEPRAETVIRCGLCSGRSLDRFFQSLTRVGKAGSVRLG
jgi:hypothetical protein